MEDKSIEESLLSTDESAGQLEFFFGEKENKTE